MWPGGSRHSDWRPAGPKGRWPLSTRGRVCASRWRGGRGRGRRRRRSGGTWWPGRGRCWTPTGAAAGPCRRARSTRTSGAGTRPSSPSAAPGWSRTGPSASWSRSSRPSGPPACCRTSGSTPRSPTTPTSRAPASGSRTVPPPHHARAALEVWRHAGDRAEALAFLRRLYPKLAAQHAHMARWRDPDGRGLAAIVHPWESGEDNSPLWDGVLEHLEIPPGALPPYQRYDKRHADPADRPTDADYDRYVYLAVTFREHGYDDRAMISQRLFCVEPPLFNAIYLWSELALAEIAKLVGAEEGPHVAAAARIRHGILRRLWDPEHRRFLAYNVRTQHRIERAAIDGAMPLLDPELPDPMVAAIAVELRSPHFDPPGGLMNFLIPSYDLRGRGFDRRRYWRGPVWINTDWLVWRGLRQHGETELAGEVEASIIGLVEHSGFREYYDPFGAQGYGSHDFSWTAALLLDVLGTQAGGLTR